MNATPTISTRLVAIVGGSGSGKSWIADRLQAVLGRAAGRLTLDDFYRDRSHLPERRRGALNFDRPTAVDWAEFERVLRACRLGQPLRLPVYDFTTHCRRAFRECGPPPPVVLVDGLWLLYYRPIREWFDWALFLECPARVRLQRRLARDVAERGRTVASVREQFRSQVEPMHARYVAPQRAWADQVLTFPYRRADLVALADGLWPLVREGIGTREAFRAKLSGMFVMDQRYESSRTQPTAS